MVQGVLFRYKARMRAQSLGITGWVMNTLDGRVEAVFEGERNRVESMVDWCHKGPNGAVVDKVYSKLSEYTGRFKDFTVKYAE